MGKMVVVKQKRLFRGVDSLLTVQAAVFKNLRDYRYIDVLAQKLCKQVAKEEVGETAIFFAPCRDAFTNHQRTGRMLEGDSRGKTMELRNEYWTTLRRFKRQLEVSSGIKRRAIYEDLFNAVMDLRRPLYLCYYDSEADVKAGTEEKKYFLLHPDFASYLIRSDIPITQT
jgi:hypothetical protein